MRALSLVINDKKFFSSPKKKKRWKKTIETFVYVTFYYCFVCSALEKISVAWNNTRFERDHFVVYLKSPLIIARLNRSCDCSAQFMWCDTLNLAFESNSACRTIRLSKKRPNFLKSTKICYYSIFSIAFWDFKYSILLKEEANVWQQRKCVSFSHSVFYFFFILFLIKKNRKSCIFFTVSHSYDAAIFDVNIQRSALN